SPMVLSELLRDIATAIDCVKLYVDRNRSFDPKNILNSIRITLITIRIHMQRVMQVINYGHSLGVAVFNDGVKTNVLAGKMAGRFTPSNPFNNNAEIA
ncbi:16738_t:CDS:2, partial [Funneliformis geosporum]